MNGSAGAAELVAQENYSTLNNSHDPLCPPEWQVWDGASGPCAYCRVIRLARADEREKAAQRIVTVELNEDGLGYIKSPITAAQGEAQ